MKNDTLILGGVMAVGVGYLGMKNREALSEMAGKISVGGAGAGGVMDLSWVGDVVKGMAGAGTKIVEVVKDGTGDFDFMSMAGDWYDRGMNVASGQMGILQNEILRLGGVVKQQGEDLVNAGKDLVNVDLGWWGETKEFFGDSIGWLNGGGMRELAKDVGKGTWGVGTGLLEGFFIDGVMKTGEMLGEKHASWISASGNGSFVEAFSKGTNPYPTTSGNAGSSSNFMKIINPDPNSNLLMSSLNNVTQGAGSVGNNRRSQNAVTKFIQTKNHGKVSETIHKKWKSLGILK